ncbi:MAG: hypothetical protein R8P61_16100 [Bacteroidia bacterium]|nr:hypothetical protein [Bacteroidia bacterium]
MRKKGIPDGKRQMDMDPKKEQWLNEVMNSLEGKSAAEPNPFLFAKIKRKIESPDASADHVFIGKRALVMAFAALALLLSLNILAISELSQQESTSIAETTSQDDYSYSVVFQDNLNIYEDETGSTF